MRITGAMTLRDGGTTCVTVEDQGAIVHVTADHARRRLSWIPRPRFIFLSAVCFGRDRRLFPGGSAERRFVSGIARAAINQLGLAPVQDFLAGRAPNPGREQWFYVLNFLDIIPRSRLRNILSESLG